MLPEQLRKSHDRTIDYVHPRQKCIFGHASMFVLVTIHVHTSSDEYNWPWCHDVVWSTIGIATDLYTCICLRGTCLTHSRSTIKQFQCHILLSNDLAGVSEISINRMCYGILSYMWIYNGVYLWSKWNVIRAKNSHLGQHITSRVYIYIYVLM